LSRKIRTCRTLPGIIATICFLLNIACNAQQSPPDAPSTQSSQPTSSNKLVVIDFVQRKSRVFPDLATNAERLTPWQKFQLASNNSVSLPTASVAVIAAAWGQALDRPSGWGEGDEAFGKRFGANMARSASDNLFGTFLIASVLHEDPRFYLRRNLTFKQSVAYAADRVIHTRSDSGMRVINYAGLVGPLASESLANTYYPDANRGAGSTFTRYGSDLAWKFGGNMLRQYWPLINKKLRLMPSSNP